MQPKKHHGQHVFLFARALNITTAKETSANAVTGICDLVPRSLVDKAEGEMLQSKKICLFRLAAPFDSCPIPSFKIYAVFLNKLSSNSSSNMEISAVSEKEKPIRKDERRKNLEVI